MMLGICTAPKENLNISSAEMVYGAPLTVPGEFLLNTKSDPDVKRYLTQLRDITYDGPYEVICPGNKSFKFLIGRQDTVSIDRLKPVHLDIDNPVQVAQPPNRGRPRQITPTLGKEQSPKS
uniref:Uncharacterized protein n=1 Tax=Octopus bimaculoides TaxID=37653 RepID=A0A0L8GNQ9_OCTBM